MNIIKQIFETPDTPSGKKRLNNLITRLGLGKKQKGEVLKNVINGELGGGSVEYNRWYYMLDSKKLTTDFNFKDQNNIPEDVTDICMIIDTMQPLFTLIAEEYGNQQAEYKKSIPPLHTLNGWNLLRNPCFVISDELPFVADIGKGYNLVIKGSLEERFKALVELSSDMSEYLHYFDYIIPLSKEEFESKIPKEIDYKDFINQ